ncbi:16S rRNA G966 N2-methylase RsmD, partial [Mycobacterium rhizamassiliense]
VRESLFNIVTARMDLTGLAVLDSDQRTAAVIARNIESVGLPGATLRRGAVAAVLAGGAPAAVDLVLADPPYDVATEELEDVVAALGAHGWLREGAVAVLERAASSAPLRWPQGWTAWPERAYGDTRLELAEFD